MVKRIIAVSGSGIGSGKTTFAKRMSEEQWSLAGALRKELKRLSPETDWFNKAQEYKSRSFGGDLGRVLPGKELAFMETVSNRQVMLEYGQRKCTGDPVYWARELVNDLDGRLQILDGTAVVAIDDVRKVCELEYLREAYGERLIHYHMDTPSAIHEAEFDNEALRARADYLVKWER